jgi:hypothetical protein
MLAVAGFALATMPRWWQRGYLVLLDLPGLGYFRASARYTLFTSLGLALLAGEGFDRSISGWRFGIGVAISLVFAGCAACAGFLWTTRADVHLRSSQYGIAGGFVWAAVAWLAALLIVLAWRARRLGSWAPLLGAAIELGILFHLGTTEWGWSIALPRSSPVLTELDRRAPSGLIGGELENLPVRAGLRTAYPYLGFAAPQPNSVLVNMERLEFLEAAISVPEYGSEAALKRWFKRFRVTHLVGHHRTRHKLGVEVGRWKDPALDRIVYRAPGEPANRVWWIARLDEPFPEARVAARARTIADRLALLDRLARFDDLDLAWFLAQDRVAEREDARIARLLSWDGSTATVEHDGPCDLVIARTFDPGWMYRIGKGPARRALPADGGFVAVRLWGSGRHLVELLYEPPRILLWGTMSVLAAFVIAGMLLSVAVAWAWPRLRGGGVRPIKG